MQCRGDLLRAKHIQMVKYRIAHAPIHSQDKLGSFIFWSERNSMQLSEPVGSGNISVSGISRKALPFYELPDSFFF